MTVYLSEHIDRAAEELLRSHAEIVSSFDEPEKIDAIVLRNIPVTAELMDRCKNLKVIGKHGVGVNTIDTEAAKARSFSSHSGQTRPIFKTGYSSPSASFTYW